MLINTALLRCFFVTLVPELIYLHMKRTTLIILLVVASFISGFALNNIIAKHITNTEKPRVTGIGGIFFKCKDPAKMREWYKTNLGLNTNQYGAVFEWRQGADTTKKGFTNWNPFKETTKYFEPSTKDYMIDYRVENLDGLLATLKKNGVTIVDTVDVESYGKFIHILDVEGNKVELWEPKDMEYEKMGKQMGAETTK